MRVTPRDAVLGRGARASLDLGRLEAVYESKHAPEGPGEDRGWVQLQAATLKAMQQKVGCRASCNAVWVVGMLTRAMMLLWAAGQGARQLQGKRCRAGSGGVHCSGQMLASPCHSS